MERDVNSDPADAPLDDLDDVILRQLQEIGDIVDPSPPDLDERVLFAIGLETLDFEVSRLQEDVVSVTGARADDRTRAVTFEADSLTIMATISPVDDRHHRIEGWLAPPGPRQVELRSTGGDHRSQQVVAEHSGRFVFERVPAGLAQFVVRLEPRGRAVVTSPLAL
jgi:hypothetical protein